MGDVLADVYTRRLWNSIFPLNLAIVVVLAISGDDDGGGGEGDRS